MPPTGPIDLTPKATVDLVSRDRLRDATAAPPEEQDEKEKKKEERWAKIVADGIKKFSVASSEMHEQRKRELEDLTFARANPEDQWPKEILEARQAQVIKGKRVAPRPCLTIPKLDQPIRQIINEAKAARLGIHIKPKGMYGNTKGADLRQGMIRSIQADSNANAARMWALERAVQCGTGYYRILKRYENDYDDNMELVIASIANQASVYFDPFSNPFDLESPEYCFVTADLPKEEFERKWPGASTSMSTDAIVSVGDGATGWFTEDTVRVAEYYYIVHEDAYLVRSDQTGKWVPLKELMPDLDEPPPGMPYRKKDKRTVKLVLMTASEVLEEHEWEGKYIPVVRVVGRTYNIEGKWTFKGVVSNAKDSQRAYNYGRSAQSEAVGLAPKAPWVVAEGQLEGYEDQWLMSNTHAFPYLTYKPTTLEGQIVPPPQRNTVEPAIQAITLMVREADQDIQATTGRFRPVLGDLDPTNQSGKAIQELKMQAELSSNDYLDNLASISMFHEGNILLDLLPKVYVGVGRVARMMGELPTDQKEVMLNQSFVRGLDGRPMPADQNTPTEGEGSPEFYELKAEEDYTVTVAVGPSDRTARDENARTLEVIAKTAPMIAPQIIDIWVENLEGPAAKKVADRLKKLIPQADENAPSPQMMQMQQQMAELGKALQAALDQLNSKKSEQAHDTEITRMKIESDEKIARWKIDAELQKEKMALRQEARMRVADFSDESDTPPSNGSGEAAPAPAAG